MDVSVRRLAVSNADTHASHDIWCLKRPVDCSSARPESGIRRSSCLIGLFFEAMRPFRVQNRFLGVNIIRAGMCDEFARYRVEEVKEVVAIGSTRKVSF